MQKTVASMVANAWRGGFARLAGRLGRAAVCQAQAVSVWTPSQTLVEGVFALRPAGLASLGPCRTPAAVPTSFACRAYTKQRSGVGTPETAKKLGLAQARLYSEGDAVSVDRKDGEERGYVPLRNSVAKSFGFKPIELPYPKMFRKRHKRMIQRLEFSRLQVAIRKRNTKESRARRMEERRQKWKAAAQRKREWEEYLRSKQGDGA